MNDRLWMDRVSPKGLRKMDYCNGIEGFINYVLSNLSNINRGGIRCPCKKYKNKNVVWSGCCNDVSSIKKSSWKNTYFDLHTKNHMFLMRLW
jgi:hypothetical protein